MRRELQQRRALVARQDGFTMIEMLTVLVVIAALLAILVPSYLGYTARASDSTAKADLRAAIPSAEAYKADNGTYAGMTATAMQAYDSGLATSLAVYGTPTATAYCLTATANGHTWSVAGPGADSGSYRANGSCS